VGIWLPTENHVNAIPWLQLSAPPLPLVLFALIFKCTKAIKHRTTPRVMRICGIFHCVLPSLQYKISRVDHVGFGFMDKSKFKTHLKEFKENCS
jgi:hypothetical protein